MSGLPVTLNAKRARVLVVGGGAAASHEAAGAAEAGATVRVVAAAPAIAIDTLAARYPATVAVERREFSPEDVAWATLVYAVADDPARNTRVSDLAQAAGKLVSVQGDPAGSTFTTPATIRAGTLTIAVAAGELDLLAVRVHQALAERFGAAYVHAVEGLTALRGELLARGDGQRWHDAAEALLDDDVCGQIERGLFDRRLGAWR